MPKPSALERELQTLALHLKKVESEYTMYFAGRTARPPVESRAALERAFKRVDRLPMDTAVARFQFSQLQARYSTFADLCDRGVSAREEGRSGPFVRQPAAVETAPGGEVLHATVLTDPVQELDKLRDLYEALMQARRDQGHAAVPFHRFAGLVRDQVQRLSDRHPGEGVRFVVTRHDSKVNLAARAVKAPAGGDGDR